VAGLKCADCGFVIGLNRQVLGETVYRLATGRPDTPGAMREYFGMKIAEDKGSAGGPGDPDAKRFPFVAKEFRYDANANQKLCIA
jgi:hypothetical protein